MTNPTEREKLKPCPFCGETPDLPDGTGTDYEIWCDCGHAMSCVQICDLMTIEERTADSFTNYRYADEFVERAKIEAIAQWNNRAALEQDCGEVVRYWHKPNIGFAVLEPKYYGDESGYVAHEDYTALHAKLAALKDERTFEQGVQSAFDLVKMAACNTDDAYLAERLEDLADDIIEGAPTYKAKWRDITALSVKLAAVEAERDSLRSELSACTEHPGGCGYWKEAAKHRQADRDALKALVVDLVTHGNPLSNVAYNLAQHEGRALTAYECDLLKKLRKSWDEAVTQDKLLASKGD
ncbi:Lar family restriction alleviation protein [Pseudomonas sp. NPDC078700]|uniref:Lar family restriction alleviation protein n=1 Tax=Pseudomonas sp. NPDC078700 TaxID=3364424 RepID=UPI0037CAF999